MRSHSGDWKSGQADRFGEAVNQPLIAGFITPRNPTLPSGLHSFASVDADHVSISTCKPAEWNGDGFIVRLVETRGQQTIVNLSIPFLAPLSAANETTLTETDLDKPLTISGNSVQVEIPAYGVKNIRIHCAANPVGTIRNIRIQPVSDMEVALEWKPVDGTAFYRVYRSTTPDFKPALLDLVAMPETNNYLDKPQNHLNGWIANRLNPETRYYYRVEAVSQYNSRGPASEPVVVTTLTTAKKSCPPEQVQDLHAILVSPLAPANQVNLLWRSNIEPNVSGYEIYRSTTPGFTPSSGTLLSEVIPYPSKKATIFKELDHQMFLDVNTAAGTTYYYKIRALTSSGQPGAFSKEVSVRMMIYPFPMPL